ncbi:translocation and assembly module TamB [mine drainage metagenome]|uniref:Translocation and assembly module TamB n=1 Tax=mine drainage metagenome TaxID=410659 RepID=A0A1J5QBZ3_9ZZZZ
MQRQQLIQSWLETLFPNLSPVLTSASADASFRRYFRATLSNGDHYIVMDAPPQYEDCHPFILVAELFAAAGVNVPRVLQQDLAQGFLLLTDLGDTTYLSALNTANAHPLYMDAIDALIQIQSASRTGVLSEYDAALLSRELQLFPDWYVARHLGATLSDDVVVLGRKPPAPPPAPAPAALPTRVHVDGRLDFGDAFHVHGSGIDAMLTGSLHVHADDGGIVRANGTVNVERGVYTAYGQNLSITSGRVNFNGPLDDPGLNIDATRPGLPPGVVVGVHLGGTALHPQATLSSDPAMPDTDMLSWLTLGMPLAQAGTSDIGVLQTAAAALLGSSDSVPLQTRLAHAVGLDSIGVDNTTNAAGAQESLVTVSKRLSSKLKVGFSRGIDGAASIFSAQYELAHRLSLRTRAGTENSVDLFYTFEFD